MTRIATTLPYTELPVSNGNFDTTRKTIDRVIIHTMVGSWQSAASRFNNPTQQVSAHYGVKLGGGLIHWLEESYTAYHAGDYATNQRSIGIEHEDGGDYNGVRPDSLYTASAQLVRDICTFYQIPIDRQHILKHSEVHPTGCPDALDIERIVREAQGNAPDTCEKKLSDTQKALDDSNILKDQYKNELDGAKVTISQLNDRIAVLEASTSPQDPRLGQIHDIVYLRWTFSPLSKNYWGNRLHAIKAIFEK